MGDHDEHAQMSKLTTWEHDFIVSIRDQLDAGRRLSEKQAETLDRRVT